MMKPVAKIKRVFFPAIFAAASLLTGQNSYSQTPMAVSLDFCADQYLLSLAAPEQIMAVSKLASNENSYYRERAINVNKFNGSVEEILVMKPDVVIATDWAFMVIPILNHYGIETSLPEYGNKAEILFKNLTQFGETLDRSEQAKLIIANYKARLKTLTDRPRLPIKVAYITPSGYTGGTGTFIDDIIKLAGYNSLAEDNNITGWQQISLEQFLLNPPDLIVSSFFDQNDVHVSHWSLTRHPKIKKMMQEIPTISIPGELISCGGQFSIETAEFIRKAGEQALRQGGQIK